jgi:hypothetical protein
LQFSPVLDNFRFVVINVLVSGNIRGGHHQRHHQRIKQRLAHVNGFVGLHVYQTLHKEVNPNSGNHQIKKHRKESHKGCGFVQSVKVLHQQHGCAQRAKCQAINKNTFEHSTKIGKASANSGDTEKEGEQR